MTIQITTLDTANLAPHDKEQLEYAKTHQFKMNAVNAPDLTFTVNAKGERIGTQWNTSNPDTLPDLQQRRAIEARESSLYFNQDGTLCASALAASMDYVTPLYEAAMEAHRTALAAFDKEIGEAPKNGFCAIHGGAKKRHANAVHSVIPSAHMITPCDTAALLHAWENEGFCPHPLKKLISKANGDSLPEWLADARAYYAKRSAAYDAHNLAALDNAENDLWSIWFSIRQALSIADAMTVEALQTKLAALHQNAFPELETMDLVSLQSIIRDVERMATATVKTEIAA